MLQVVQEGCTDGKLALGDSFSAFFWALLHLGGHSSPAGRVEVQLLPPGYTQRQ